MNKSIYAVLMILSFFLIFFFSANTHAQKIDQVCFRGQCIDIEVVQSKEAVTRGLMFREALEHNSGMLFIFRQMKRHIFWMENTLIPLDIIWLDQYQKIVHIARQVPVCFKAPCPRYAPADPALFVLEINAGGAIKLGLKPGDRAEFIPLINQNYL